MCWRQRHRRTEFRYRRKLRLGRRFGVNDIGGVNSAAAATSKATDLINAFKKFITKAHANNIRIYGATILPFNGSTYYNQYSDQCRNTVNQWIRLGGFYDSVIDSSTLAKRLYSCMMKAGNQQLCGKMLVL